MGSAHRTAAVLPRAVRAWYKALPQPTVSPSGFLWQRIRTLPAACSRAAACSTFSGSVMAWSSFPGGGSFPVSLGGRFAAVYVQLFQQLVDVGRIGRAVVLYKDQAGGLADVHLAAELGADMAGRVVQRLDDRRGPVGVAQHADIDLCHIQVGRHVQPGDGQQAAAEPRVLEAGDDGDELPLHILGQTAHVFLRHILNSCKRNVIRPAWTERSVLVFFHAEG